jgi:hypothetical protein
MTLGDKNTHNPVTLRVFGSQYTPRQELQWQSF